MGESVPVATPLTDMGAANYQGYPGGLYPDGNNVRPAVHESHGRELSSRIVPLDAAGLPNRSGRIVLISVGMSTPRPSLASSAGWHTATPR